MKSLKIVHKILGPTLLIFLILCVGLVQLFWVGERERTELKQTTERIQLQNQRLQYLVSHRRERQRTLLRYQFQQSPTLRGRLSHLDKDDKNLFAELKDSTSSARESALVEQLVSARGVEDQLQEKLLAAIEEDSVDAGLAFNRWSLHSRRTADLISDLTALNSKALDRQLEAMDKAWLRAGLLTATLLLAAALISVFLGYAVNRFLARPLVEVTRATHAIASGHLDHPVNIRNQRDELGQLALAFNTMTQKLASAHREVGKTIAELHRSNSDLRAFAYISSHDLKEPLRMIALYSQMLQRDFRQALEPKAIDYLDVIVESARRMQELIEDLLVYSEIGVDSPELTSVDLQQVVNEVLTDLRLSIEETKTEFKCDPLPTVAGHPTQLRQVFENLIANGIKFHQSSPKIHIRATEQPETWTLSVKDNGIGIRPEYRESIFDVFKRLHPRKDFPGTGIGLAICKKIVERHGGRIWVESIPAEGSVFYFTLPKKHSNNLQTTS